MTKQPGKVLNGKRMMSPAGTRPMAHDRYGERSQLLSVTSDRDESQGMLRKHSGDKRQKIDTRNLDRQTLGTSQANHETLL